MQRVKLFSFPTGRLLVSRTFSLEEENNETPFLLITKTEHPSGVQLEMKHCYADVKRRNSDFEAFGEEQALKLFTAQQTFLAQTAA